MQALVNGTPTVFAFWVSFRYAYGVNDIVIDTM